MVKAAKDAATAASGGTGEMIGKVVKVANAAAKGGDATSVNGIAGGIKGIVEAAEKAGEEGKLESEAAAGGEANEDAGKLFAKKADATNGGDAAAAAEKAATAVVLRGLVKLLTFFQLQLKFFCFHLLTFKTIGILFIESFGFKAISSFYIFFFFRNFSL